MKISFAMLARHHLFVFITYVLLSGSFVHSALSTEIDTSQAPYKIGVLAYKGKEAAVKRWVAHEVYLNQRLAPLVFVIVPLTYTQNELTQAVINRQVDFVITNPGHYTELELGGHVSRLATRRMSGPQGVLDQFGGTVITRPDRADLNTYADLAAKQILIPSQSSLGGWQVHLREAMVQGIDLRHDAKIVELKNHKKVVTAILAGEADAGFVRSDLIEELAAQDVLQLDQVKIINKREEPGYPYLLSTRLYPEWPIATVNGTPPDLAVKVLQALLDITPDDNVAIAAGIHGWTIPGHYGSVGDLFYETGLGPYANQPLTIGLVMNKYWLEFLALAVLFIFVLLINTLRTINANHTLRREITDRKQAEEQARQGEIVLNSVFSALPDLFFLMESNGVIRDYRAQQTNDLYIPPETFLGKCMQDVLPPSLATQFEENRAVVNKHGGLVTFEYAMELPHGLKQFEARLSRLPDCHQLIAVIRDITERRRAEDQIRTLSQAIEQSPVSVYITDLNGNIEYVNNTFERTSGYSSAEIMGQNVRLLISEKMPKEHYESLWQAINSGKAWQGELQNRKKNGEIFWDQVHIAPVLDESGAICHYLAVNQDITLRKQHEEQILHQAHFDTLTDLPNRFLSLDRLSQLLNEAQRNLELVAVLFLDLDDFKKINDTLGHDIGDKLLIEAAERLRSTVRDGDTVGRLGGDEFIILLGGITDAAIARPVAESLLSRFRDIFRIDGRELILTASVGIAIYPNDGDNPMALLRNADTAMYYSKERGRNTYCYFTDAMNQEVSRRLALEEQMHGALDRGEFRLYYQPKVLIDNCRIIGVEALLRWNNPVLGEVSPTEFIPIAEQTGLIIPIGQFVLTEALGMAAKWQQKQTQPLSMAVNLSPSQFRDPNLVDFIEEAIGQSGLSGEFLELEITEGVLMSGHTYIADALASLNDMGVSIAMDDFGTGYSSLSYLRSYPFDTLKIDRSFVQDITLNLADQELINAAIAMAHGLGLKVVAEGVENEEQLAHLAEQHCDFAQGNFFSKPVPAEEIKEMLKAGNIL